MAVVKHFVHDGVLAGMTKLSTEQGVNASHSAAFARTQKLLEKTPQGYSQMPWRAVHTAPPKLPDAATTNSADPVFADLPMPSRDSALQKSLDRFYGSGTPTSTTGAQGKRQSQGHVLVESIYGFHEQGSPYQQDAEQSINDIANPGGSAFNAVRRQTEANAAAGQWIPFGPPSGKINPQCRPARTANAPRTPRGPINVNTATDYMMSWAVDMMSVRQQLFEAAVESLKNEDGTFEVPDLGWSDLTAKELDPARGLRHNNKNGENFIFQWGQPNSEGMLYHTMDPLKVMRSTKAVQRLYLFTMFMTKLVSAYYRWTFNRGTFKVLDAMWADALQDFDTITDPREMVSMANRQRFAKITKPDPLNERRYNAVERLDFAVKLIERRADDLAKVDAMEAQSKADAKPEDHAKIEADAKANRAKVETDFKDSMDAINNMAVWSENNTIDGKLSYAEGNPQESMANTQASIDVNQAHLAEDDVQTSPD